MSDRGKTVFIVNLHAGNGAAGRKWPFVRSMAEKELGAFAVCFTAGPGDAVRIAREQLSGGADLIVSVGGDGTLNEVINGFMDGDGPPKEALLGMLPLGTACDLSRLLLPSSPKEALRAIKERHTRHVDLGRIHFIDHKNRPSIRYFHNVVSFGIGGEVVAHANETGKAMGAFLSYLRSTLVSLLRQGPQRIFLRLDNGVAEEYLALNIAVANGRYHGGGMCVAPAAVIDDGIFHVTVIGDLTLPEIFLNFIRFYNGRIAEIKKVLVLTGARIEATSERRVRIDMDGEQPGLLPALIEILPRALPLIVDRRMMQNSPLPEE